MGTNSTALVRFSLCFCSCCVLVCLGSSFRRWKLDLRRESRCHVLCVVLFYVCHCEPDGHHYSVQGVTQAPRTEHHCRVCIVAGFVFAVKIVLNEVTPPAPPSTQTPTPPPPTPHHQHHLNQKHSSPTSKQSSKQQTDGLTNQPISIPCLLHFRGQDNRTCQIGCCCACVTLSLVRLLVSLLLVGHAYWWLSG